MAGMVRAACEAELLKVAAPLSFLVDRANWAGDTSQFDLLKSGVCGIVAYLAYCAVGADEKQRRIRAKVILCGVYQRHVAEKDFDFVQTLARFG